MGAKFDVFDFSGGGERGILDSSFNIFSTTRARHISSIRKVRTTQGEECRYTPAKEAVKTNKIRLEHGNWEWAPQGAMASNTLVDLITHVPYSHAAELVWWKLTYLAVLYNIYRF